MEAISLQHCPELSSDSTKLVELFSKLSNLKFVNLGGNSSINDDVVNCILNVHGSTLESLSLNAIDGLTERSLLLVSGKLPKIKELDISWVRYDALIRSFTDILLVELLRNSKDLSLLKIFGCNRISHEVLDREWYNGHGNRIVFAGNEFD